jgi:formate hydrogenlyase transcriptional activator
VRPPLRIDLALPRPAKPSGAQAPIPTPPAGSIRTEAEMRDLERANLMAALEQAGGRVGGAGGAAEILRVRPSTLRDRMRAFGIPTSARSSRG